MYILSAVQKNFFTTLYLHKRQNFSTFAISNTTIFIMAKNCNLSQAKSAKNDEFFSLKKLISTSYAIKNRKRQ